MDMLPTARSATLQVQSLSREQSQAEGPQLPQVFPTTVEVEANNPPDPELDAEAPGPHIVGFETIDRILDMYSQDPVSELEGQSRYAAEL